MRAPDAAGTGHAAGAAVQAQAAEEAKGTRKATLKVAGKAGKNSVRLPRRLKQSRYALVVSVRDLAGNVTAPAIKTIKLRKA